MVKLIQYDYIMRSEVFSTNAFIQICNFSMNAALFRRFACRLAAFLAVWGGQTEREAPLADFKLHAARFGVCVGLANYERHFRHYYKENEEDGTTDQEREAF